MGNRSFIIVEKSDQKNHDIYIQQLGTNQVLQLTSHAADDMWPAWSPDGKYIAFCRSSDDSSEQGLWLMSSLGGIEKKLSSKVCMQPCWSPDGRSLAFSNYETGAILLLNVESRQDRQLTFPKLFNRGFWIDRICVLFSGWRFPRLCQMGKFCYMLHFYHPHKWW